MVDEQDMPGQVEAMTDAMLLDIWRSASEEETENLSPFLEAVVEEMGRRNLPL
jgi:hypothetical protein